MSYSIQPPGRGLADSTVLTPPLSLPPQDHIRWGFIGVGGRGEGHLGTVLKLKNATVTAVCDTHAPSLEKAASLVQASCGHAPFSAGHDDEDGWRRLLDRDDVDAVVISTAWEQHAPMAIEAMNAGKHAFVEVPAALTLEEAWGLVDTSEATGKHCMMLENCNYGREELMLLNMVRQDLLGELLHGEASYIHDLRIQMFEDVHGCGSWRTYHYAEKQGNLYPTHGVGPVAHCMNVNRGDAFSHLVSMSSPARGRALFAQENFAPEHQWNQISEWRCGDLCTTIIKLVSGKTITVSWDETSPRPYSRRSSLYGTRGSFETFPNRISLDYPLEELPAGVRASTPKHNGRTNHHEWDSHMEPWFYTYDHPLWRKLSNEAEEHGGHGGMDYILFWRIQQCLLEGKPLDQSVYDAALWSCITPLSAASIEQGSAPQEFPDFTRGQWKTTPPLHIDVDEK